MSHFSLFHIALLIYDNMRKSSEKSKKGSSKEVSKAIGRLKDDRFNSFEGVRTQVSTSSGASVLGGTFVSRMKNLKNKKPADDNGSETDDN